MAYYLVAENEAFRIREGNSKTSKIKCTVPLKSRAEITSWGYVGEDGCQWVGEDGYQWVKTKYGDYEGYSQLDTRCYYISQDAEPSDASDTSSALILAQDFVNKLESASRVKTAYMWGTFGAQITSDLIEQKAKQYPNNYSTNRKVKLSGLVGKGYWAFDCAGLIKGILWGWNGNKEKKYGGATYQSYDVPDTNVTGLKNNCNEISSNWDNIAIGELVFMPGHVGVYIGYVNNVQKVVEATLNNSKNWDGVVITDLQGRGWTEHGKLKFVNYSSGVGTRSDPDTITYYKENATNQKSGSEEISRWIKVVPKIYNNSRWTEGASKIRTNGGYKECTPYIYHKERIKFLEKGVKINYDETNKSPYIKSGFEIDNISEGVGNINIAIRMCVTLTDDAFMHNSNMFGAREDWYKNGIQWSTWKQDDKFPVALFAGENDNQNWRGTVPFYYCRYPFYMPTNRRLLIDYSQQDNGCVRMLLTTSYENNDAKVFNENVLYFPNKTVNVQPAGIDSAYKVVNKIAGIKKDEFEDCTLLQQEWAVNLGDKNKTFTSPGELYLFALNVKNSPCEYCGGVIAHKFIVWYDGIQYNYYPAKINSIVGFAKYKVSKNTAGELIETFEEFCKSDNPNAQFEEVK